ncbi:uncharacterized protein LOC127868152 isoform X2 [Dreissena polymorpha]|nr:uncharacterized protein LOC127868152 isoform X2 [Dreissena polymorpha]XP_052265739.1 uncharacterized protein LOC127868152 isoform X2 [Dreissena polymorpha]
MKTRMDKMDKDIDFLKIAITEIQQLVRSLANIKTKPKRKQTLSPTKAGPSAVTIDLLTQVHMQEALRKNFSLFRDLCLDDGHILDRLFECDCITFDDYQAIRSKQTNHEMIRALIFKIRNRAPSIIKFLSVMKEDPANEELCNKFNISLSQIKKENQNKAKCAICVLKATVDIRDIVYTLWSEKIISEETFELVGNQDNMYSSKLTQLFWENVTESIRESNEKLEEIVIASLQEKYAHLTPGLIDRKGMFLSFECCYCRHQNFRLRTKASDVSDSFTDLSTTSEYPNSENDSAQSSIFTDYEEEYSSREVVVRRDQTISANIRLENRKEKIKEANTLLKRERLSSIVSMADDEFVLESEPNNTTSNRQTNDAIETVEERRKGKSVKGSPRQSVHFNVINNSIRSDICRVCNLEIGETRRLFSDTPTQTDPVDNAYGMPSKRLNPDEYNREQYKGDAKVVAGALALSDTSSDAESKDKRYQKDTSRAHKTFLNPAPLKTTVRVNAKYDKPDSASNVQSIISLFNRT